MPKHAPAHHIETVLDGSSGGSGFKQKAKGILNVRQSSRNSSITSSHSGRNELGTLEFGQSERKPKSPRVPTLRIPLGGGELGYSSNKFRFDSKVNQRNLSISTERSHRYGGSELSPRKQELLTKFFPTKSQLYSVLSRLNKPEMLLLKNLKRQYHEHESKSVNVPLTSKPISAGHSHRAAHQEESILETDTVAATQGFKINGK